MNYCLLRLVDADCNNNKEYEMKQLSDSLFEASWGRIKGSKMKKSYSMNMWDKIRREKIKKGYTDVTKLVATVVKKSGKYGRIPNDAVRELVDELLEAANEHIRNTYEVDQKAVTPQMVKEAQKLIDNMNDYTDKKNRFMFNKEFQKLLVVIPQKIKDVAEIMAKTNDDMLKICMEQQATLDVLKSMLDADDLEVEGEEAPTILEAFGLDIRPCTDKEISKIKEKLSAESEGLLDRAFRIEQKDLEARYKKYVADHDIRRRDEHFLWHGTRNQNVWSIAKTGMLLNPKAAITGKMFGYGLYFAPRAKKSIGYTSIQGSYWAKGGSKRAYMFVMKVAYKKPLDVYSHRSEYCKYHEKDIRAHGCDAMFAHKGQMLCNDEIIVYNEAQVCPRYLLVLKAA